LGYGDSPIELGGVEKSGNERVGIGSDVGNWDLAFGAERGDYACCVVKGKGLGKSRNGMQREIDTSRFQVVLRSS
jgi:hypothetical protein